MNPNLTVLMSLRQIQFNGSVPATVKPTLTLLLLFLVQDQVLLYPSQHKSLLISHKCNKIQSQKEPAEEPVSTQTHAEKLKTG